MLIITNKIILYVNKKYQKLTKVDNYNQFYVILQPLLQVFNGLLCPNLMASSSCDCIFELSTRLFNSVAKVTNTSSMFRFSLADVSNTNNTSGINWHICCTSSNSTARSSSKSHLLQINIRMTLDAAYRLTSSIHFCKFINDSRFVMSNTAITYK